MIALLLAALIACPLVSQGLLTGSAFEGDDGVFHARDYTLYIENPSPFDYTTSRIDVWIRDGELSARRVIEGIPRTVVPKHTTTNTVVVHFQDLLLDLHNVVGSSAECDVR